MADRDHLDDLLDGLDQPVAPRAAFVADLRARLLAELARPASFGDETIMQPSASANERLRALPSPRRPHWLMTAFEIAAALLLLLGFWQFAGHFFGSPEVGPDGGNQTTLAALTQPAATVPASAPASPVAKVSSQSAMAGGDPGRTGQQPGPAPSGPLSAPVVTRNENEYNRGGAAPVAVGDTLYRVASIKTGSVGNGVATETHLEAREIATGALKWSVLVNSAGIIGSPAVADGRVFVFVWPGDAPGKIALDAYSAVNGDLLWSTPAGSPNGWRDWFFVSPIVADGVVYGAGIDGTAYAIDAATGAARWISKAAHTDATISEEMQPGVTMYEAGQTAVGDGHLYVVNANADVAALNLADGSLAWSVNISKTYGFATRQVQPFATGDQVLLLVSATANEDQSSTQTNRLISVQSSRGKGNWKTTLPTGARASGLAITDGKAVIALHTLQSGASVEYAGDIQAYNLSDGALAWDAKIDISQFHVSGLAVAGRDVYFANNTQLFKLDSQTGDGAVIYDPGASPGDASYTPVISNGFIVLDHGPGLGEIVILSGSSATTPTATTGPVQAAMAGGDPARSGSQAGPAPRGQLTSETIAAPSINFSFDPIVLGDRLYRSVILDFGATPTTTEHGYQSALQAVNLATDTLVWSVSVAVVGSPAATKDLVFANVINWATSGPSDELVAFDAATGAVRWSLSTGQTPAGTGNAPAILDGIVYTTGPGQAFAVEAETGAVLWRTSTAFPNATPVTGSGPVGAGQFAIGDGRLYLINGRSMVAALDLATGSLEWTYDVANQLDITPGSLGLHAVSGGVLLEAASDVALGTTQLLVQLDGASGRETWRLNSPAPTGSIAVGGGVIVVAFNRLIDGDVIRAYDLTTHELRWGFKGEGGKAYMHAISIVGDQAIVAGPFGAITTIDLTTGTTTGVYRSEIGFDASPPLVSNGRIVLGRSDGSGLLILSGSPDGATPTAPPD